MLESDETFQFHILITLTLQASIAYEVHFLRQVKATHHPQVFSSF